MKSLFTLLTVSTLGFTLAVSPLQAQEKPLTKQEVESVVRDVIRKNPEIIIESLQNFQKQQEAKMLVDAVKNIATKQDELTKRPGSPVIGNPKGDITLVEFFDYHCGYCKHFFPVLQKLVEQDKNVRVVLKEFPILSEDSELAAKAALAVFHLSPDTYFAYHAQLMKMNGTFTKDALAEKAVALGLNKEKFLEALESEFVRTELNANRELAQSIGISGTPAMVIGKELVPGVVDLATLKEKLSRARKADDKK